VGRKVGRLLCPFPWGGAGSSSNTMSPGAEVYFRTKWHLDPSNRLATIHQRYRQTENRPKIGKTATFSSKIKSRRTHRIATMKTTTIAVNFLADTNSFICGITCGGESWKQWDHTARRKVEGTENDTPKAPE